LDGSIIDRSWFTASEYAKYRAPGHVKVPFWLQPDKYYAGVAWYQREVEIPSDWVGKRLVLYLERPHWETRVWLDDRYLGSNNSLFTPHVYELGVVGLLTNEVDSEKVGCATKVLSPGKHTLTIRVDNRRIIDIGENSHGISDHTQGNWNGIVGRMEIIAQPLVWLEDVQVFPQLSNHCVRVRVEMHNATGGRVYGTISLSVEPPSGAAGLREIKPVVCKFDTDKDVFTPELEILLGNTVLAWDEFSPALYTLKAEMVARAAETKFEHTRSVKFGLRELGIQGTQFTINGRKTFFRGTLECCVFPNTGHPPVKIEEWRRIMRIAKSFGLNMLRFHSYCPPEVAFDAADELGMYLQVETCWPNQSTTLGDGKPVDSWVYEETDRILRHYGNHPSFVLMAACNEPGGKNAGAFLAKYVQHFKTKDPRRLWTSGAGWPQIPENQFHITPDPRIQWWGGGLRTRINARPPETITDFRDYINARKVPVISHEIGQWCVYPDFDEIPKYTGYLKPKNFEIFRDFLEAHHLGDLARQFLLASGKLQVLCYKEEIESALRTPGIGGFQLLGLTDFPGQGTALVGVLDAFWDEKGYVSAQEFRRFCNETVLLARFRKRVFTSDERLESLLEVAHFGPGPLQDALPVWKLVNDSGHVVLGGALMPRTIPVGNGIELGRVSIDLNTVPAPARYKFVVELVQPRVQNDWDIWVYPTTVDTNVPPGIVVTHRLNEEAQATLDIGGKVLLLIPTSAKVPGAEREEVVMGFSSIFWNTAWTQRQAPHTLGILCDPLHPLFNEFPTDFHSNWQWWYLISRARAMIMDHLPPSLRPLVFVIDDWFTARRLGLVIEARVGIGKLLICSVDLENDLGSDPVRRQFRYSLLRYMQSEAFQPKIELTKEDLVEFLRANGWEVN